MKLGEIKIQALNMMYPDVLVRLDDTSDEEINNSLYELKTSPNYEGILESMVGAVNRALAFFEAKEITPIKCVDVARSLCAKTGSGILVKTENDFLCATRLLCHRGDKTYDCAYETRNGYLYTEEKGDVYTVVYRTRLQRITRVTPDSCEMELDTALLEAIPYYILWDLFSRESKERAMQAKEQLDDIVAAIENRAAPACHGCFQTIYSME